MHASTAIPGDARVLVTGGSGFIGTNLVAHFINQGIEVLSIDIVPPRLPSNTNANVICNLLDLDQVTATLLSFQPSHIFHLGARTDLDGADETDYAVNTVGLRNLVSAQRIYGKPHRAVYASSRLVNAIGYTPRSMVDYNPTTAYGMSKVAGERIIHGFDQGEVFKWIIVRPTSIWGPWFDVPYRNFFDHVLAGRYLHPTGAKIYKSFGFVGNAVHQLDRLMANIDRVNGGTFYISDYDPIEVGDFADSIRRIASKSPNRRVNPSVLAVAARLGDGLKRLGCFGAPPITSFRLRNLLTPMVYDLSPTHLVAGPLPFTWVDGITETLSWLRNIGDRRFSS